MQLLPRNHVVLLRDGAAFFPALLTAIASARHSVWLETYIFTQDETGQTVANALQAAAARGVQVNLLLDGFGSGSLSSAIQQALLDAGVRLLFFRPEIGLWPFRRQRLRRLHRKLALVDGRIGFVGGINIINDKRSPSAPPRFDYAVEVTGPVCMDIAKTMSQQWRRTCRIQWKHDWAALPRLSRPAETGEQAAALVIRNNGRHRRDIENAYLTAMESAQREIIIANAYFLPGVRFRRALVAAAARGVKVTLLLQGRLDHALLQFACRGYFHQLVKAGVRIVEYRRGQMHAKVAVIDHQWSTVGSSNIDPFSILVAREANLIIRHIGFAKTLRQDLLKEIRDSGVEVSVDMLRKRWWGYRVLPWLAYQMVRALMGMAGYGQDTYRE